MHARLCTPLCCHLVAQCIYIYIYIYIHTYGTRVYNVTWYGAVTAWAIVQLLALSLDALASTVDTA